MRKKKDNDLTADSGQRTADFLSLYNTQCLKGLCAIVVLLHHLYQYSQIPVSKVWGLVLQSSGYLAVAVFFFLSGYGLMTSYKQKGDEYLKSFIRRRVMPLYCIMAILVVMYSIVQIATGFPCDIVNVMQSFVFGKTVVSGGWYLQVQLLLYLIFYCAAKIAGKPLLLLYVIIFIGLYAVSAYAAGLSTTWYESTLAFTFGIGWSLKKELIVCKMKNFKVWLITTAFCFTSFCTSFLAPIVLSSAIVLIICKMLSSVFFVAVVIQLLMKIRIDGQATYFLGKISLEMYVLQGIFLIFFHSSVFYIANPYLYIVAAFAGTMTLSVAIQPIFTQIMRIVGGVNNGGKRAIG